MKHKNKIMLLLATSIFMSNQAQAGIFDSNASFTPTKALALMISGAGLYCLCKEKPKKILGTALLLWGIPLTVNEKGSKKQLSKTFNDITEWAKTL